jgi:hypothetical protein
MVIQQTYVIEVGPSTFGRHTVAVVGNWMDAQHLAWRALRTAPRAWITDGGHHVYRAYINGWPDTPRTYWIHCGWYADKHGRGHIARGSTARRLARCAAVFVVRGPVPR